MADKQKYDYLTAEEQLSMVRPRITQLERDHFAVSLDVIQAGEGNNPAQEQRAEALAQQLQVLKDMETELESKVNKEKNK